MDMKDMKELLENSIRLYPGIVAHWPSNEDETLDLSTLIPKLNRRCYAVNNSTVCLIVDYQVYVTPSTRQVIKVLNDAGFEDCGSNFYVPFSNGGVPKLEAAKWEQLRKAARQSYRIDFTDDCGNWCDEHHIGRISEKSLAACFRMPEAGVPIKNQSYEGWYYPVCTSASMDSTVVEKLGTYSVNNGVCAFVYRDGATYVAKGSGIFKELYAANFSKANFFVPFSNGEVITDPELKALWDSIPKK